MEQQLLKEAYQLIHDDLELSPANIPLEGEDAIERLRKWLASTLEVMITQNLEGLLQVLYRLDIAEEKAQVALCNMTADPPALALADLIIEREIQKAKSRAWYRDQLAQKKVQQSDDDEIEKW